jgi:hypothetical protein
MHRPFLRAILALPFVALAATAPAQSIDEIVARHHEAVGGLAKLKAVRSLRMTGKIAIGPGIEAPSVMEFKDGKFRLDAVIQGMTLTQAYDGQAGWQIVPFQGNKNAERMSPDDTKDAQEQADFHGPLVDTKAKGHSVELAGEDKVEGADAFKLKITLKNGDVRYAFIDKESFLSVKSEAKRKIRGTEVETENFESDYKEVGGLLFAHAYEGGPKGAPAGQRQKITVEKIELNPAIDDARFVMPAAAPAPATPVK